MRDDGAPDYPPGRPSWGVVLYPAGWLLAVLLAVFALGLGNAVGAGEQAISLVRSYVKAREQGSAGLACSMLTREQQRELVAIQTHDYRDAYAGLCPTLILRLDPNSNLQNPALEQLSAGPLTTAYTPLGAVLVHSPQYPDIHLIAVFENGRLKLDIRGLEKVNFIRACTTSGQQTSAVCLCTFDWLRAQEMLPDNGLTESVLQAIRRDKARCQSRPAAIPA